MEMSFSDRNMIKSTIKTDPTSINTKVPEKWLELWVKYPKNKQIDVQASKAWNKSTDLLIIKL